MMAYAIDGEGKVVEARGTLSQAQMRDGVGIVVARDPSKADADPETGGWKVGVKIPQASVLTKAELQSLIGLSRNHIVNAIAFSPQK